MAAGSVIIDLLLRSGSFETDTKRAEKRLQEFGKAAKQTVTGAAVALAGFGTAAALGIKHAIDQADEMSKLASKVGITTESLSHLAYAAKLSDVGMDGLGNAIKRLGQFQVEALKGGKDQVALLKSIGIEAGDAATGGLRSAEDMLRDLADVFAAMPDGADKTALAVKLLGKSGSDLIPLLNGGSKALDEFAAKSDAVGFTLREKTGKDAEAFNDTLSEVGLGIDGLWRDSLPKLLPELQGLAEIISSDDFRDGFGTIISGAVTAASALAKFTTTVASTMQFLGEEVAARTLGPSGDDIVRIEDAIARKKREIQMLEPRMHPGRFDSTVQVQALRAELAKLEEQQRAFYAMQEAMARKAPAFDPTLPKVDIPKLDWGGVSAGGKSPQAQAAEDTTRALMDLLDADKALYDQSIADVAVQTDQVNAFTDLTMQLEGPLKQAEYAHIKAMQEIERLGLASGASADAIATAKAKETAAYNATTEAILQQQDAMANPDQVRNMDQFRYMAENFLVDLPTEGAKAWKDFFDNLASMFMHAIAQKWVDQLFGPPGTTGKGTTGGDIFGSILSMIGLGSGSSTGLATYDGSAATGGYGSWDGAQAFAFGGARALGGDVLQGRSYLVGEDGPEMFTPRTSGAILPADAIRQSGRGQGVTQNVTFLMGAPTERRTQDQIAAKMSFATGRAARRNG
jgi:hypothetical protein